MLKNAIAYPNSLYVQQPAPATTVIPHAIMTKNTAVYWNGSLATDPTETSASLTTGILRHLAHCFGFGSSLVNRQEGLVFLLVIRRYLIFH